jgi:hypothetical protein
MKKIWINCDTDDYGECWEVLANANEVDNYDVSSNGNRAVIKLVYETSDYVVVSILPAARKGYLEKEYSHTKRFYIKLSLMNGDPWFALSKQFYSREEALKFAELFTGLTKTQAMRVWQSKKLGEMETNVLKKY